MENELGMLPFVWRETDSLARELASGFERLSIATFVRNVPVAATLWQSGDTGLRIRSQVFDLAERVEVGVLEFTKVKPNHRNDVSFDVPASFKNGLRVQKLLIVERSTTAESGLMVENADNQQIVIVAGAIPHTLTVRAPLYTGAFEPEYPLSRYQRASMA
jgi:hypothetical protein